DRVFPVRVCQRAELGTDERDLGAADRLPDFAGDGAGDGAGLGLSRGDTGAGEEDERCSEERPEGSNGHERTPVWGGRANSAIRMSTAGASIPVTSGVRQATILIPHEPGRTRFSGRPTR